MLKSISCLAVLALTTAASAVVEVPAIFSDNMVLQRSTETPLWGTAAPGERIAVRFDVKQSEALADADGNWRITLDLSDAPSLPGELVIQGDNSINIRNVVVGEVWLCSGQSNMEWTVDGSRDYRQEAMDFPGIRQFVVAKVIAHEPQTELHGQWVVASPETTPLFSAVGFYFARALHEQIQQPVGLVNASWGGTGGEAWTSERQLRTDPAHNAMVEKFKPAPLPNDPSMPAVLYNGMIHPIIRYRIKGVLWYQGEGNEPRWHDYERLLTLLIEGWRSDWGIGDFPFYIVQLAGYRERAVVPSADDSWVRIRDAQWKVAQSLPHSGIATAIDIGDADDIHPKNKQEVGRRLALIALARDYGKPIEYSGPQYDALRRNGNRLAIAFTHADGLKSIAKDVKGFAIAGSDGKFVWAEASIVGNEVIVWSDEIAEPAIVRYGWEANPDITLYNAADLPALPFEATVAP